MWLHSFPSTSYWIDNLFYIMANLVAFLMFFLKTGCYNLWVSFWVAELWIFPKSVYLFWVIAALHFVLSWIKFILLAQDILFFRFLWGSISILDFSYFLKTITFYRDDIVFFSSMNIFIIVFQSMKEHERTVYSFYHVLLSFYHQYFGYFSCKFHSARNFYYSYVFLLL